MPIFLIIAGSLFIVTGIEGDPAKLWTLVKGDFTGPNNYVYWTVAIIVLGFLGYVDQLKNLSRLFIALVVIVLLLDNKGFFAQLQDFINTGGTGTAAGSGSNPSVSGGGIGADSSIPDPFKFKLVPME